MKFVNAEAKKGADETVARIEAEIEKYKDEIERVKSAVPVWEAEKHKDEEPLEVLTISGRAVVGKGDYVFTDGARRIVIPKEIAENKDLWVRVKE